MKSRRLGRTVPSYHALEPRQLLATTGLAQFDGDTRIDSGLIANASFDANEIEDASSQWVQVSEVDGWQSDGASDTVSLVGFDDSPRLTGLHLDAQADVLESVYQDVSAESGQLYTLGFDLLGRPVDDDAAADSNDIEVLWDGESLGSFRGISDFWQSFTVDIVGGDAAATRLEIREVDGAGNDGVGAMLDNLRLIAVNDQSLDNGSFEDNGAGLVADSDVPAWSVVAESENQLIDIQSTDASDGTQFVNLDRQSDDSDILFTDVATEEGAIYFLSFDLRSESGDVGNDEEVRVRWNGQWAGTYRGSEDWQGYGFTVAADSDLTRLVFREPGDGFAGDGSGPQLDNVRLTQVIPSASISLSDSSNFDFTENGAAVTIGSAVESIQSTVTDGVTEITVSLPSDANTSTETLSVESLNGEQSFEDGVLTISGEQSDEDFLSVLQSLQYASVSEDLLAGAREIVIVVENAAVAAASATLTVNVTAVNDAPVVSSISDFNLEPADQLTTTALASDVDDEDDDLTWAVSATGTAIQSGDAVPAVDDDGNISWTAGSEGEALFTVRATDAGGLFDETQFTVTVAELVTLDTGTVLVNAGSDLPLFDATLATDPAIGETFADFEAQTINGEQFNSVEPGVARIYSALAHWCPACQSELPEISEWLEDNDLGDDVEFVAAAVSVDSTRDNYPPADWFEREEFSGTVIVDNEAGKLMDLLGTTSVPFLVAVDASGQVVERISSLTTSEQLDSILATLRG